MNCFNCGIKNPKENNFCCKCGFVLNNINLCNVCKEDKILTPLTCGHSFCKTCLDNVYSINNHCPQCRKKFYKCDSCNKYRMQGSNCLDCRMSQQMYACNQCNFTYTLESKDITTCINCNMTNIKTIPINIIDLENVIIKSKVSINPEKIEICKVCFSSNLEKYEVSDLYKCLNCNKIQDTPLIISAKDINNYPQIDKDLIDPKTIEICEYCFSNDILIGYGSDSKFNICNNCNKTNINGMRILEKFKKYFKIKEKNIVNPQIIKICNNCYGDNFKMVLDNDNTINLCTNCNSNFDSSISIFEHNKEMYPLKKDIYFNLFNT